MLGKFALVLTVCFAHLETEILAYFSFQYRASSVFFCLLMTWPFPPHAILLDSKLTYGTVWAFSHRINRRLEGEIVNIHVDLLLCF